MTLRPSSRSRAKQRAKLNEPGRAEWKADPPWGPCDACGKRGPRIRHHGVREQDVRHLGGDPWDQSNAMLLGKHFVCNCHRDHHAPNGRKRISLARVPDDVHLFARQLMGPEWAADYLAKHYAE